MDIKLMPIPLLNRFQVAYINIINSIRSKYYIKIYHHLFGL